MNYPGKIKKDSKANILYANRGMDLEYLINLANNYYVEKDIALIYKKPTPIGVVRVNYNDKKNIIEKAFFKEPSTLDYNGLYRGKYIEFEAKETKNKTAFPLANIHNHQIKHIKKVIEHKGIAFLIISINNCIYLLDGNIFINYLENNLRKSIPFEFIKEKGRLININLNGLNYLDVVNDVYFGGTK